MHVNQVAFLLVQQLVVQVVGVVVHQDASQTVVDIAKELARATAMVIVRMDVKKDVLDVRDVLQAAQMVAALHALEVVLLRAVDVLLAVMDNVKTLAEAAVKIYVALHVLRNVKIIALLPAEIIAQE